MHTTGSRRVAPGRIESLKVQNVRAFMDQGVSLGDLWMEGHFNVGDPLTNQGGRRSSASCSKAAISERVKKKGSGAYRCFLY